MQSALSSVHWLIVHVQSYTYVIVSPSINNVALNACSLKRTTDIMISGKTVCVCGYGEVSASLTVVHWLGNELHVLVLVRIYSIYDICHY